MHNLPLAIQMPGMAEWIVIAAVALLLFGKRLPEVGRSLGQGIVEFKKGLKGLEGEVTSGVNNSYSAPSYQQPPQNQPTAYKFDPYTGKPIDPNPPSNPQQ